MKMERLSLLMVFALGCSSLVNSALDDNDGDSGVDAGTDDGGTDDGGADEDAGPLFDCRRMPDGTPCGDSQICINNLCESSRCGDGFITGDEECDELNDVSGDGCEPGSCVFSCTSPEDCDDGNLCTTNSCEEHVCETALAADGTECDPPSGENGTCMGGLCVGEGCGNGTVDGDEDCDDDSPGCVACRYACTSNEDCQDTLYCNGDESCNMDEHVCVEGSLRTCDDADECTLDSCSESRQTCINTLIDEDNDGYASDALTCADATQGGDCQPSEGTINPGASELCDMIDNDCDDNIDETEEVLCFPDRDNDGFGGGNGITRNCACEPSEISRGGDCNDGDSSARPTQQEFFPEPHCRGPASECFDYNCDDVVERRVETLGSCEVSGIGCSGRPGWAATRAPGCGVAAPWITGCTGNSFTGCRATMTTQTQQCR